MIELLKCFATGLGVLAIALTIVGAIVLLFILPSTYPLFGYLYLALILTLLAVMIGWLMRSPVYHD